MLEKVILPTAQGDDILFFQEATMSSSMNIQWYMRRFHLFNVFVMILQNSLEF